jgi:hypothetical protein
LLRAGAVTVAGLMTLAGCTQAAPKDSVTGPSSSVTAGSSGSSAAPSHSSVAPPSASARPSPTGPASLGGRCEDILPVSTVNIALRRTVIGGTAFVLGVAEPDIGRLTYLNCRYGLSAPVKGKPAPVPLVEIGLSLYNSPAQAARRAQGTVDDYLAHGASLKATKAAQTPATVLLGYGSPTIVAAAGPRTVAVTVSPKLVAAAAASSSLAALAKAALDASAQFTLGSVGAGSASPSSTG